MCLKREIMVVNGDEHGVRVEAGEMLAQVLREQLGITSVKVACERGECGSCTVLLGDDPIAACITPAQIVDEPVTTVEGLADESRQLREALADRGGFQCGFCTPWPRRSRERPVTGGPSARSPTR